MFENMERAFGEAYFYYNEYVKDAKAKNEEPLTFLQLMFGKRK